MQPGLEGVRRDLEGHEDEGEDFEDERLKSEYDKVATKRAAWRCRAEAAPPGDRARLNRAAWRASLWMANYGRSSTCRERPGAGGGDGVSECAQCMPWDVWVKFRRPIDRYGTTFYTSGQLVNSVLAPKASRGTGEGVGSRRKTDGRRRPERNDLTVPTEPRSHLWRTWKNVAGCRGREPRPPTESRHPCLPTCGPGGIHQVHSVQGLCV